MAKQTPCHLQNPGFHTGESRQNNLKSCLQPNSLYRAASFAKFKGILDFFVLSIILADLLGNTCLLVIGAFRSTLFVSVFQGSLLVIALFWAIVCLLPSTKSPLIIAISFAILEQSRVILSFVFAGQAGHCDLH